ncbi:MAG: extracellular solute-binding protein [Chlorobia bacterium]|nr:extracellular solute-binding protein [Fimbriimonadaceae bacterium]
MLLCVPLSQAQIRFWAVTGSIKDTDMYKRLAVGFESETGIHVEVTPLAWGNFATKYFTAMAAGLPPDIGVTNLGGPFDYGSVGGLVDLRAEFPKESQELESRMNPQLLGMFTFGDKLFGIPSDLSTCVLYYRTDVFGKLNLKPPKTWSELNGLIDKLEAAGYRCYFGFPSGAQWSLYMYTLPFDRPGLKMGPNSPEVNWNDPLYQKGVLQAMKLWHMHDSPGKDLSSRVVGMFRSEDPSIAVPMFIDLHTVGGNIYQTAPEIRGKWDVAPWPRADDGVANNVMGGTAYVIFRNSKHKSEAMKWMMYLNSRGIQEKIILDRASRGDESALSISPLPEIWADSNDAFWSRPEMQPYEGMRQIVKEIMPSFRTLPNIQGATEASRMESNLLDQMSSYIRDQLDEIGRKSNITRSKLFQKFGAGEMAEQKSALESRIAARLKSEYAKIQPTALATLQKETARYEQRYGDVVRNLPDYERRSNVHDVVKLVVGIGLAVLFAGIIALPKYRKHWVSYAFVGIPIILAVVFVFVPAITALYLSFTDYHPVLPLSTAKWVGTQNYTDAFSSGDLGASLLRTLKYGVYTLPIGIALALVFAYLLNSKIRGQRWWRFLYFSPLVTSVVSISLIFSQLFLGGNLGWLNAFMLWIGAIKDPIPFLTSEHSFLNCIIILAIWHGLAFTILVFLAGLQQIPDSHFEAAAMDGANPLRRFWSIAVPGLRPQIFFITVLGLIGSFQVFETIFVLANKSGDAAAKFGPNDSALTMVPLIYHTGFETYEMGKSAAFAYILFVLILILTAVQFGIYRRKGAID